MNYAIGNLNESYYKYLKKGRNSLAAVMPSKLSLFFSTYGYYRLEVLEV